jgi:hypothetical protein
MPPSLRSLPFLATSYRFAIAIFGNIDPLQASPFLAYRQRIGITILCICACQLLAICHTPELHPMAEGDEAFD